MTESPGSDRVFVDKQTPQAFQALREVAKAVRAAVRDAGLDTRLVELVNVRVSQLNGCAYCLDLHAKAARSVGETERRLAVLPAWRDTDLFSHAEQAALRVAESVTTLGDAETRAREYTAARAVLSPEQFSAVVWVAIAMNSFNRVSMVSRHPVEPEGGIG